jgi:hypothetical protein
MDRLSVKELALIPIDVYLLQNNNSIIMASGTKENPWKLKTPPQTSEYEMYRGVKDDKEVIVCVVGSTTLFYDARCLEDLHTMLKAHGDWMDLGGADEQKPVKEGTVEAWGRSPDNPVGGWYGLKKGLRGRFGVYIPPLMEALGLAEVTHDARNNKMRAI